MTGLSYVSIIADTQGFNKGTQSFIPEEHGVLSEFWSAGVLEMGCWSPWRRGGLGGGGRGGGKGSRNRIQGTIDSHRHTASHTHIRAHIRTHARTRIHAHMHKTGNVKEGV